MAPDCASTDPAQTEFAYELQAYQRYLAEIASTPEGSDAYLMYEPSIRFVPAVDDVLVPLPDLRTEARGKATVIHHPAANTSIALSIESATAQKILLALDGNSTLLGVQFATRIKPSDLDEFLRVTFGRVVFAPRALEQLERRVSGTELVRFVGSPYEIRRNYWSNMADCRERILGYLCPADNLDRWLAELSRLHIIALMGASTRSYYRPQSPLAARDPRPGAFYTAATRCIRHGDVTLLIEGPRVSAPPVGGRIYLSRLAASVDDPDAMLPDRVVVDELNPWGTLCLGFARYDSAPAPWFCPPRPITSSHWEQLYTAFHASIRVGSPEHEILRSLADFHWCFIRLHPFRCANQSLSMAIVNAILVQHGMSGIPHFLLDQWILRFSREAYRQLFARAVRQFGIAADSTLERWRSLGELRGRIDRFVKRIGDYSREQEAVALIDREQQEARAALLLD